MMHEMRVNAGKVWDYGWHGCDAHGGQHRMLAKASGLTLDEFLNEAQHAYGCLVGANLRGRRSTTCAGRAMALVSRSACGSMSSCSAPARARQIEDAGLPWLSAMEQNHIQIAIES